MDDTHQILRDLEKETQANAVAIERAHADAREAKRMAEEFRPIVMDRSGDVIRRDKAESNLNDAHDKIREIRSEYGPKIESLEKWKERIVWIGAGLFAAGQAAWFALDKWLASLKH